MQRPASQYTSWWYGVIWNFLCWFVLNTKKTSLVYRTQPRTTSFHVIFGLSPDSACSPYRIQSFYSYFLNMLLCSKVRWSVVPIDGIYDFPLALDSNLTSIFNCSWGIMPCCAHPYPPLFQVELGKGAGSRWTCFGVRVPRTLDYPSIILNMH